MNDTIYFIESSKSGIGLSEFIGIIIAIITSIIAIIGFVKGLKEYKNNNRIKKAEFLEKLIDEFNDNKMFLAKRVLDDFYIDVELSGNETDVEIIEKSNKISIEDVEYVKKIKNILRNHKEEVILNPVEHRVRQSFDDLLDFFEKLVYYFELELISPKELKYFKYYIEKCFEISGVKDYAKNYGFKEFTKLKQYIN